MSAQAHPRLALRPFLPTDAPLLAEIFRASIEELAADDYGEAQRGAWASAADDEEAFARCLAQQLTLVATLAHSLVGFVSLRGADEIDMLYVHPAAARQGVGALLCDAIERLAASRGTPRLTVDASDSARGFFERRGFTVQQRNSVLCGDEWLANTTMEKKLAARSAS